MRVAPAPRPSEFDNDAAMTPMIDVVFLLLVFFVWTFSYQAIEAILPSRLAAQTGGPADQPIEITPEQDFDQVVIRLDWENGAVAWRMNDSTVAGSDQLRAALQQIHGIQPQAPIIVHPAPEVPLGFVIQAYDLSRVAGFTKVSLAAALNAGDAGVQ